MIVENFQVIKHKDVRIRHHERLSTFSVLSCHGTNEMTIFNSALRCVGAVKNSLDIHSLPWGARCDDIKQCFAKYHCFLAAHYRN